MEKQTINAVATTRRIRTAHAEQLKNASPEDRIRFYREKARRVHADIARQLASPEPHTSSKPA